ncbi:MAG: hypothetical protein NZM12_07955 [Steroidobacteraceae bacterium]|nr:hypothetical protein [Steroidobacteraceae bacterium]
MRQILLAPAAAVQIDDYPLACSWAADGSAIAVAGGEGGVFALRLAPDGSTLDAARLGEHAVGVLDLAGRPGSLEFSTCGEDGVLAHWDLRRNKPLWRVSIGDRQRGEKLAWRADGAMLACASGRRISLWRADGTTAQRIDPLPASVNALAWSPDRRDLGVATHGAVTLLRVADGRCDVRRFPWSDTCLTVDFSPNSRIVASGMQDSAVHFWYLLDGRNSQMRGYPGKVDALSWSGNSRYLATGGGNDVIVWDFSGRGPEGSQPLQLRGHTERITALAFQPGGTLLASAGRDWRLSLWQPGKSPVALDAQLADGEITLLSWAPDGQRLLIGASSGQLQLYCLRSV